MMKKGILCSSSLLVLVLAVHCALAEEDRSVAGKKVILFGWDNPEATEVAEQARHLQKTGLDGVVLNFSRRNVGPNPGGHAAIYEMRYYWVHWQQINREDIQHNIDALKAAKLGRLKHNFLSMYPSANATYVSPAQFFIWDKEKYDTTKFKPFRPNTAGEPQSWPEDPYQYFNAFKHNMVMAARICRELGLAGFCIDQETYDKNGIGQMYHPWVMEVFDEDLETIKARMRKNVAEVFRAVCEEYPEIQILLIPGGRYFKEYDHNDALVSAFTDGILMGLGPKASLHDGQEKAYYVGSLHKRFVALKEETRRKGLKYSAVPDLYRKRMKYSFGIWLDCRSRGYGGWHDNQYLNHHSGRDFGNALYNSLYESDDYVWIYNEKAIMWPAEWRKDQKPNVNEVYFEAIRNSKKTRPLNLPRDPRGAQKESRPRSASSYKTAGDRFETAAPELELIAELKDGWEIWFDHEDIGTKSLGIRYPGGEDKPDFDWQPIQVGEFWERQGIFKAISCCSLCVGKLLL